MTTAPARAETLQVEPRTPAFGAVVRGLDASTPLDEAVIAQLREAIGQYKVVFLPGLGLSTAQQWELATAFGEPFEDGKYSGYEEAGVSDVKVVAHFHADFMYLAEPPKYSMLQMLEVPGIGGDTIWTDLEAAYEALSPRMRAFVTPLRVRHAPPAYFSSDEQFQAQHRRRYGVELSPEALRKVREEHAPHEHPLVRRIPETGTLSLWLSEQHTRSVTELEPAESDALLRFLFRHQLRPDFITRWQWSPGDIAFWDHRRTLHSGVADFGSQTRRGRRVTVGHERPVPASASASAAAS